MKYQLGVTVHYFGQTNFKRAKVANFWWNFVVSFQNLSTLHGTNLWRSKEIENHFNFGSIFS